MINTLATIYFTTKMKLTDDELRIGLIGINYVPRRNYTELVILYENGPYTGIPIQYILLEDGYDKRDLIDKIVYRVTLIKDNMDWPDDKWFMEGYCYKAEVCSGLDKLSVSIDVCNRKRKIIKYIKKELSLHSQEKLPIEIDHSKKIGTIYFSTLHPSLFRNSMIRYYPHDCEFSLVANYRGYPCNGVPIIHYTITPGHNKIELLGKIISDPIGVFFDEECADKSYVSKDSYENCYKAEVWDVKTEIDDLIKDKIYKTIDWDIANFREHKEWTSDLRFIGYETKEDDYYDNFND